MNKVCRAQAIRSILLVALIVFVTNAWGYEVRTHLRLSLTAFEISGVSAILADTYAIRPNDVLRSRYFSFAGGPYTPTEWVRQGGAQEDFPFWRVLNHFYDPVRGEGL